LILKCGHTVCETCTKGLLKNGRVKCPFDNQTLDHFSIERLGRNFSLLDLIDLEQQKTTLSYDKRMCDMHPTKKIKFYC
jgi:hypothetical protein